MTQDYTIQKTADQSQQLVMRAQDWNEDAALENGNYENICGLCRCGFIGHKRRILCRRCYHAAWQPHRKSVFESIRASLKYIRGRQEDARLSLGKQMDDFRKGYFEGKFAAYRAAADHLESNQESPVENDKRVVFHLGGQEEHLIVSIGGQVISGADLNAFCEALNNDPECQIYLSMLAQSSTDQG